MAYLWSTVLERPAMTVAELVDRRRQILAEAATPASRCMAQAALALASWASDREEAASALEDAASLSRHLPDRSIRLGRSAIQVCQALVGGVPAGLQAACETLSEHLTQDSLSLHLFAETVRPLGVDLPSSDPARVLLGVPPTQIRYRVNQLLELARRLRTVDATASVIRGGERLYSVAACVDSTPFSVWPGVFFELPLDLAGARDLLIGPNLHHALSFVEATAGRHHEAWRQLSALRG